MYISDLEEFNKYSGLEEFEPLDKFLLKKANIQIDNYLSPQVAGSPFSKALPNRFRFTAEIENDKVTLDKEYKQGLFDFTRVLIKGDEFEVLSSEVLNSKTVLTISKSLDNQTSLIRIYQKSQAPFSIDTIETDNEISKVIRSDIKEAVVLQYKFLEQNPTFTSNQKTRERLQGSNYEVEFRDGKSTTIEEIVSPEAKLILEKYKPYL